MLEAISVLLEQRLENSRLDHLFKVPHNSQVPRPLFIPGKQPWQNIKQPGRRVQAQCTLL